MFRSIFVQIDLSLCEALPLGPSWSPMAGGFSGSATKPRGGGMFIDSMRRWTPTPLGGAQCSLPPINGLEKLIGCIVFYKYLVPTGLAEYKRILLSSNFGAKVLLECFDKAPMNFIHFFIAQRSIVGTIFEAQRH